MKQVSCGLIISDFHPITPKILVCHVTGQRQWDIPKGLNEDESYIETCIREIKEEIGLNITKDNLEALGLFKYIPGKKDLYLFKLVNYILPNINKLKCTSYFINDKNISLPEVDAFQYIGLNEVDKYCTKNLVKVLKQIF